MSEHVLDDLETALENVDGELPASVDRAALERMRVVAKVLDDGIPVPGIGYRIGIDPIVGILPGAGDAVASAVSLYIVLESARLGVSHSTLVRMLGYVAVDTVGGSVPVLGTVFDAFWKANRRNFELALSDLAAAAEGDVADDPTVVEIE